jgi:uncharacterized protein YndB with AHSA1/START domain
MSASKTDRIEKKVLLHAPRSRVWRAIADADEFGQWFRVKLDGKFVAGSAIRGQMTYPGYEHVKMEVQIERIEPETYFSYRWHPYAVDMAVNYAAEPTTLVEFRLLDVKGGTELTITESGFDKVPAKRRAEALRMNEQGWSAQSQNIADYVAKG